MTAQVTLTNSEAHDLSVANHISARFNGPILRVRKSREKVPFFPDHILMERSARIEAASHTVNEALRKVIGSAEYYVLVFQRHLLSAAELDLLRRAEIIIDKTGVSNGRSI